MNLYNPRSKIVHEGVLKVDRQGKEWLVAYCLGYHVESYQETIAAVTCQVCIGMRRKEARLKAAREVLEAAEIQAQQEIDTKLNDGSYCEGCDCLAWLNIGSQTKKPRPACIKHHPIISYPDVRRVDTECHSVVCEDKERGQGESNE